MEYISTSVLANELEIKSNDLFDRLERLNFIERINDKWTLTNVGKQKGGQTRTSTKFGVYIVWPENISIDNGAKKRYPNFLMQPQLANTSTFLHND